MLIGTYSMPIITVVEAFTLLKMDSAAALPV
jgi:hypothetical protein